jgi:hypothetical protein
MLSTVLLGLLQTTWIVDAAAGPGSHFTDLPPAIAAAASGDTILVRAGSYSAFTIAAKELAIRGAGAGVTIVNGPSHLVASTPAGGVNLFAGLSIRGDVTVSQQARVELLDCLILGRGGTFSGSVAVWVTQSELLVVRCQITGGEVLAPASGLGPSGLGQTYAGTAVMLQQAYFAAYDCDISGGDNFANNPFMQHAGGQGLAVQTSSWARVDSCRVTGGDALHVGGQGINVHTNGHVQIQGDATDFVRGGTAGFGGAAPAIHVFASPLVLPSFVTVHGTTPITGTVTGPVTFGAPQLPELTVAATTLPSGETDATQPVTVTFDGLVPSAPFALLIGFQLDYAPSSAPLVGDLLVNAASAAFLTGLLDAAGQLQFRVVPAGLFGGGVPFPFYMQCAVFDPSGAVRLSNLDARFYSL